MKQSLSRLKIQNFLTLFLLGFLLHAAPAHAYAGPGAAIGVVIVFITVVLAFFGSVFISLINFISKLFRQLINFFKVNVFTKERRKNKNNQSIND